MKHLAIAFNLLTILPVRAPANWQPGDSGRAAGWYPVVGLVIGGLVAGAYTLLDLYFSTLVTAALSLLLWVILGANLMAMLIQRQAGGNHPKHDLPNGGASKFDAS